MAAARRCTPKALQAHRIELARPGATEAREASRRSTATAAPRCPRPECRNSSASAATSTPRSAVSTSALTWTTIADGARVARIEVASLGAAGIRVAVRMPTTHPDVQVRFAGGTSTQAIASVPANTIAQATARFGEYWSPVIDGERAAIEIEAEKGATLAGVTLEIARVSHLVVARWRRAPTRRRFLADIGDSGSCNINVGRRSAGRGDARRGRRNGKLVFTVPSGGTARCTGTLLNDTTTTFTPYIFGANHCFQSAYEAFTLNVWWFFDRWPAATRRDNYVVQAGGAMLLGRSQDWTGRCSA
jgi:hypothetical protein